LAVFVCLHKFVFSKHDGRCSNDFIVRDQAQSNEVTGENQIEIGSNYYNVSNGLVDDYLSFDKLRFKEYRECFRLACETKVGVIGRLAVVYDSTCWLGRSGRDCDC